MERAKGFAVTFRASADTGYVISEAVRAAITADDPMRAFFILSRLVASMPAKLRSRVQERAAQYLEEYARELEERLTADLPDPRSVADAERRKALAAERVKRVQLARMEASVRALLSALGDVGGDAGFWFTLRRERAPGWQLARVVDGEQQG